MGEGDQTAQAWGLEDLQSQGQGWLNKAREQVQGLGTQVQGQVDDRQRRVQGQDGTQQRGQGGGWTDFLNKAKDGLNQATEGIRRNIPGGLGDVVKDNLPGQGDDLIGTGARMLFPQFGAIEFGGNIVGNIVAKRQAKELLNDPKLLAQKMEAMFPDLDKNQSHGVDKDELRAGGKGLALLNENRAVVPIMASGWDTLKGLDGSKNSDIISRQSVQAFSLLQDKQALEKLIDGEVWDTRKAWGIGGGVAGGGLGLASSLGMSSGFGSLALKVGGRTAVGRVVGGALATAVVVGGIAGLVKRNSEENAWEEKGKEVDTMLQTLRQKL